MATYRGAGVDLDAAARLVTSIGPVVRGTWSGDVVGGFGGFAAGIRIPAGFERPVLMMSTDGVGTKVELARETELLDGLGFDVVAMCVDDLAATGARALAFTDYLAVGRLTPEREARIVASVAAACSAAGCPLLGGETAEHPGVMAADAFDLAGAALGIVEDGREITGAAVQPGDPIVGIASPNPRSNGFSLIRALVGPTDLRAPFPGDEDRTVGEVLVEPSVIYAPAVLDAAATGQVRGLAHITGGALPGNLPRMLPPSMGAVVHGDTWPIPEVFGFVQRLGEVSAAEMFSTFNMGIGFAAVVSPAGVTAVQEALARHGHRSWIIGEVVAGHHRVVFA